MCSFNTVMQIALVLKSQEIEGLGCDLWYRISDVETSICEDLYDISDPRDNFVHLKRLVRKSIESSTSSSCIPCLGLWMADLEKMWKGLYVPPPVDLADLSDTMNLTKLTIPWGTIREIARVGSNLRKIQDESRCFRFKALADIQEYITRRCAEAREEMHFSG